MTWSSEGHNGPSAAEAVLDRLDRLAALTDEPGRITRLPLGPAHKASIPILLDWMRTAGMAAGVDANANVVGRYEAERPGAPALILGSHIDTVPDGGRFDGPLGIVLAIAVVERLHREGRRLAFAIEVIAFGDEEGVRFGAPVLGSRAAAGLLRERDLDREDAAGITVRDALTAFGLPHLLANGQAGLSPDPLGYVEVHIEQGPVLETLDLALGRVTAISGATRLRCEMLGHAGHAGNVPMAGRRDAYAAAAEAALAVERLCRTGSLVGTVGHVRVEPNAGNVIPGRAVFSIDIRSPDDGERGAAVTAVEAEIRALAGRRQVGVTLETVGASATTPCAAWLMAAIDEAIASTGQLPHALPSGAGHDGMYMSAIADVGMIFVRCCGGISHHPDEDATVADLDAALQALDRLVRGLDVPESRWASVHDRAVAPA